MVVNEHRGQRESDHRRNKNGSPRFGELTPKRQELLLSHTGKSPIRLTYLQEEDEVVPPE